MNNENFINLVKGNTYFKRKGSCIDLILTNGKYSFKYTSSTETSLSDHHYLISSIIKTIFEKEECKVLVYQDYKNYLENLNVANKSKSFRASVSRIFQRRTQRVTLTLY